MPAVKNLTAQTTYRQLTGKEIPAIGLGVWQSSQDVTAQTVYDALNIGYRHIDSAQAYHNEKEVGEGIVRWLKEDPAARKRSDVFYTTKVFRHGYEHALASLKESFEKIKELEYIDLVLVHNGRSNKKLRLETYAALQEYVDKGIVKSIGVSNWGISALTELLAWDGLKHRPTVDQIELHPFLVRQELTDFLNKEGIVIEAYSPLTRGVKLDDATLVRIGKRHNKTSAQVLIRWSLERGYVSLPKSTNPARLRENFDVYDFELTEEEFEELTKLDENWLINTVFGDQIYWEDISDEEYFAKFT
jgi:diketogulonate reductase-like aldo/keto reductase